MTQTDPNQPSPSSTDGADGIHAMRERFLSKMLAVAAVAGLLALFLATHEAHRLGDASAPWFYLGLYIPVLLTALLQQRIPFALKTSVLIGAFFALAVHNLLHFGFSGAGIHVFLLVSVLMTVLLGQAAGIITILAGLAALLGVGLAMSAGVAHVSVDLNEITTQMISWVTASGVFLLLAGTGVLVPGKLQSELSRLLETLKTRSRELSRSNTSLEREIAERRRAEEALRESERRFRTLFEYAPDAYYINDLEGRILDGNRAAEALIGGNRRNIIGKTFLESGLVAPEYRDKALRLLQEGAEGRPTGPDELLMNRVGGGTGWIEVVTVPMDMDGRRVILGIARDITNRRQAEEETRRLEKQLHRAQKMEAMGFMAGGVAHDLNNILSGIVNYPELMLLDDALPESVRTGLETIRKSGDRAAAVVSDLLTVARGVAVGKEPANLNTVVGDYLQSPEHKALLRHHEGVHLEVEPAGDLLPVKASPVHLRKALMNLVSNAFDAVGEEGRVTLTTENRYVDQALRGYDQVHRGEYAVLTVADTGPGISTEDLEHIFEPFYTKKAMGRSGTGLGLAVVWNILQDHEGYIDVRTGDAGTAFDLYLPVTREAAPRPETEASLEDLRGRKERILVVDDEKTQRDIATRMLSVLGYEPHAVTGGEEAVAYLQEHEADLVILDMIMPPGQGGRETWERIRTFRPDQKALIASGYTETEDVRRAQEAGAGAYIKKPYTLKLLGEAVRKELGRG